MGDRSYISVSENTTAKNALCLNGCAAGTYAPLTAPSFVTCIETPYAITPILTTNSGSLNIYPVCGGQMTANDLCLRGGTAQSGFTLSWGGDVNIKGGCGCADTSGCGGTTFILGGDAYSNTTAYGGNVYVSGGSANGGSGCGGDVYIGGGSGNTLNGCVALMHASVEKLVTTTSGVCVCDCAFASEFHGDKLRINLNDNTPDSNIDAMFESSNNCEAVRIYGWSGSTTNNVALRVSNNGGTSNGGNCAIYASAYYNTPVSSGRSHGIWATAGNKTNRYNYGVIGQLLGTQEGAGIVGVLAGWSTTLPAGCWAGVFDGNTHTCGTACVTTAVCTPLVCNPAGSTLCVAGATGVKVAASTTDGISVTSTIVCLNYAAATKLCTVTNGICLGANCGFGTDWVATSDCRLKTNITPISSALSIVSNLCGVYYKLCNDETKENRIGLIAQDVNKVLPEIVSHSTPSEEDMEYGICDDKLGLKYDKLTAVLIEAVKELRVQNESLQLQINELKNK
jgi:hypothetical protein